MAQRDGEWFHDGSSNAIWTGLAVVAAGAVVLADVVADWHPAVTLAALLFVLLSYVAFLRPAIGVVGGDLVLRHLYSTQRVPVATVEKVAVGRTLQISAGGRHYVSSAVMRPLRQAVRLSGPAHPETSYPDFVEARILHLAEESRATAGIRTESDAQRAPADGVRRTWSWPLIALTLALAIALVLAIVL